MHYITNDNYSDIEQELLEFILKSNFRGKEAIIDQLNQMQNSQIVRDYSPHHMIMEFHTNGISAEHNGMSELISLQVLHGDGSAPAVLTLYEKEHKVFEYEIYNADSSEIDISKILIGTIHIEDGRQ